MAILKAPWRDRIPTDEIALEIINGYFWNLTVSNLGGIWYVRSGDQVILTTDTESTLSAFLYGFATAYWSAIDPLHVGGRLTPNENID